MFSLPRRVRPVGPEEPAPRAVEPVQRPRAQGRARARVPDQQLDRARRVAVHRARAPRRAVDLLRASRGRSCAAAARWCRSPMLTPPRDGEARRAGVGAVSHRRRHHVHGAGGLRLRPPLDAIIAETAAATHHRARRDAPGRPDQRRVDGAAQEGGVLLMSARDSIAVLDNGVLRFLTAGSVDDGKSTLIGRLLYDTKAVLADQLAALERTSRSAAHGARPVAADRRAAPPSASKASRSTSRTAISRPRGASSSSPTRRATSSTRATW